MPPKRPTRSSGPPQSAAVVNPIRASSKKKKKVRQPSTSQRPTPTPSNANADATEDAGDAHFLRLSRIATLLRDAAADHPSAHGPLLDFLKSNWTPQGAAEVPFQSTPRNEHLPDSHEEREDYVESSKFSAAERVVNQAIQFLVSVRSGIHTKLPDGISSRDAYVYSAMQLALVSAPSGFHGFLTSLEALQDHLRQLFDDSKKGRTAYRDAQCFLTELNGGFKRTLGHAKAKLGGEYAVELLFHPWEDSVLSEDLDYFDPLGLLRTALENNTAAHYKNLQKLQARASAQRAFASSAAPAPFPGHGQARFPPPPPGLNIPKTGKNFFYHIRKTGRFPMRDGSCVLCGKGEEPGSQGHRAEVCGATDQEINNWVEHGVHVK
jgi:hypothetical protein